MKCKRNGRWTSFYAPIAPKVFKEPRGGSHLHLHADQLTLNPSTRRSAHPQQMAEWRKAPFSIPGDIVSGSQNGQDRCVFSHQYQRDARRKEAPSFATPKSWLLQTLTHLPHPPFFLYYTTTPCSNGRFSSVHGVGDSPKKEKDWHLPLSPWPINNSYCSTPPPPTRAGRVGGIISLCRMHHVAGVPHQLHMRFSRVNRHVIK